jgi:hypothetical protein
MKCISDSGLADLKTSQFLSPQIRKSEIDHGVIMISTLLFMALPSSVVGSAMGRVSA